MKDHWVADHVRDELIEAHARSEGATESSKPKMMIDTNGVPHAFCISEYDLEVYFTMHSDMDSDHSELMAEKVKSMIDEIVMA